MKTEKHCSLCSENYINKQTLNKKYISKSKHNKALADQKAKLKKKAERFIISINPFFKVDGTQQQLLQILVNNYLKEFEELTK